MKITSKSRLTLRELCIFALLGALMFATKTAMQSLPNIHLLGLFICASTLRYRAKALYPIYVYVFLDGLFQGFASWWLPYLYIWTVLWGAVMLLPKNMSKKTATIVLPIISALHGLCFGILYSPCAAFVFGLDFKGTLTWIASGFSFDCIHAVSNFITGFMILPLVSILKRAEKISEK